MYLYQEDDHVPSQLQTTKFCFDTVKGRAVALYQRCPSFIAVVYHITMKDDTTFYCIPLGLEEDDSRNHELLDHFIVPTQDSVLLEDHKYGIFALIQVRSTKTKEELLLVSNVVSRAGILLRHEDIGFEVGPLRKSKQN